MSLLGPFPIADFEKPFRVLERSKPDLLDKIIQNVFFHLCASSLVRYPNLTGALGINEKTLQYHSVGRPKHVRVMAGALEGDVFIGRRAQEFRGLLKIKYPMEHGIVTDWDDMERIWSWVYAEELGTLSEEVSLYFFRHLPQIWCLRFYGISIPSY